MSRRNPELNKKLLLEALERSLGLVTPACKEVGLSKDSYYDYYNKDENFRNKVDEINNLVLDFVESQLYKKIADGDTQSILFYMKYKGRKRGYTEAIDVNSNVVSNVVLNVKNLISFDDDTDSPKID